MSTDLDPSSKAEELLPSERARTAELNFISRGRFRFSTLIKEALDWRTIARTPFGLRPVLFFGLTIGAIDLARQAFSLQLPDIITDLDIRAVNILSVIQFITLFLIFFSIPIAYYSDRIRRIPVVGISGVITGIFCILTGRAQSAGTLGAAQVAAGVGRVGVGTPANSLLADYYPAQERGKAFATLGMFTRGIILFGPLIVAYVGTSYGWRLPFYVIGPLLILLGLAAFTLKNPKRGYMERKALGADEEVANIEDEPPSMAEAWRMIWGIKTIRRIFITQIPDGTADTIYSLFFPLFLFQVYQLSLIQRGWLIAAIGGCRIIGLLFGGGIVDVLTRRRPQRMLTFTGVVTMASAFVMLGITREPPFWAVAVLGALYGLSGAISQPASQVAFAQVLPPNVRSLGYASLNLAEIPGTVLFLFIINTFLDRYGVTFVLTLIVPFVFAAGLLQASAAGFFERDLRSAFSAAAASEEWRRTRAAGRGKLLVCRDVDVEYDGVQVLFDVDFDIEEGEIVALLGTNGAGKSTLLRAISGVNEAAAGAVVFDGRDITHMPPNEIALRGVIHMPGGRGVFPGLSVRENLQLGNWMINAGEARGRLDEVLRIFPVLRERQNMRANLLSGGEQQMLSLAQAFLCKPRLLMIDELSLGLGPSVISELADIVRGIHQSGVTVIIVEQSVNVALSIAEKAIFMEKGEVRFVGKASELLGRPEILRAVYVKGAAALEAAAPSSALKSERELRQYELSRARAVLQVQHVTKSFGGIKAVDDVSFDLREGEALGLIGPNGAGKTTLFDLISGYQIPDSGRVVLDSHDITRLRADERAHRGLVRRFQDARMFPSLTAYENILVALDKKLDVRNLALTAMQLPHVRQSERRVRLRAERLIELLDLGDYRDKFVRELSTGLRRIVDLACMLATEPKVLMLDEPSTGIAQAETEGLAPLLRRVRFETGCSMVVIEHSMSLISAISDDLVAMDQGRIITRGAPDDVLNDERVIESYLGGTEDAVTARLG